MKLNLKLKPEMLLTLGTVGLGVAQMLLTNKKDANDKAALKEEILKELTEKVIKES